MKAELLHVVTAIFNPMRFRSRIDLYRKFEHHMLDSGVHLTTIECVLGSKPFPEELVPKMALIGDAGRFESGRSFQS